MYQVNSKLFSALNQVAMSIKALSRSTIDFLQSLSRALDETVKYVRAIALNITLLAAVLEHSLQTVANTLTNIF